MNLRLRDYQADAVERSIAALEQHGSDLIVLPTGGGKTIVLSSIVKQAMSRGRWMVVAHTEELIGQLASTMRSVTGAHVEVEMAGQWADMNKFRRADIVVSTVQTQRSRKDRFKPDQFAGLLIDEAHRSLAASYTSLIKHYRQNEKLWVLGATATPFRSDGRGLGQNFASNSTCLTIRDLISDGWLVPVKQKFVVIQDLDFEPIGTQAGDLNPSELEEAMMWAKPLHEVVSSTIQAAGDRRTMVFAVSVRHAERLKEAFNAHKPGSANAVFGITPKEERRDLIAAHKAGEFQYMLSVSAFTEGYDDPGVQVIAMARPTKSRLVYAQALGRGIRALPGTVDGLDSPDARRLAIASSAKPHMTVLDFVGNAGRHKIMSAMDALAGTDDQKVIDRAKKQAMEAGDEVDAADAVDQEADRTQKELDEARAAEIARRAQLRGHAQYELVDAGGIEMELPANKRERWKLDGPATPSQIQRLTKTYNVRNADKMSYGQAQAYLIRMAKGRAKAPASSGQEWYVRKIGKWRDGMTAGEASRLIAMSKKQSK